MASGPLQRVSRAQDSAAADHGSAWMLLLCVYVRRYYVVVLLDNGVFD